MGYHTVIKINDAGQSLLSVRPQNHLILLTVFSIFKIKMKRFQKYVFVSLLKITIINPFHVLPSKKKTNHIFRKNNFIVQNKKVKLDEWRCFTLWQISLS